MEKLREAFINGWCPEKNFLGSDEDCEKRFINDLDALLKEVASEAHKAGSRINSFPHFETYWKQLTDTI